MGNAYASVLKLHGDDARVTAARMFGTDCLKVGGKVFAMDFRGRLVVKLPAARVRDMIADGHAEAFDPGHGRRMKKWASIGPDGPVDWNAISVETRDFVSGGA